MGNLDEYVEYRVSLYILRIVPPLLLVFGTAGNVTSIVILMQRKNRISSTARFLTALAVCDTLSLLVTVSRNWPIVMFDVSIAHTSPIACKCYGFLVYFSSETSSWFIVAITVERFVCIFCPHRTKQICSLQRSNTVIMCIFTALFLFNVHLLFGMSIGENSKCYPTGDMYAEFYFKIWPIVKISVASIIPFLIVFVGNTSIMIKMRRRERSFRNQNVKSSRLMVTLVLLNVVFLVCITPMALFMLFLGKRYLNLGDTHEDAVVLLLWSVVNVLYFTNNAVNFLLYFLSGSRFRKEVRNLCCVKSWCHSAATDSTAQKQTGNK
ncbi:probable G-protein coupled receptor B0563.6 [Mercenaria mercenaria]|uniref:probable G-protein coupled receptor B0563.6 n=1 Tax=Mercenaria mercenaria TaxID=6596 RepID=UPI00234EB58A|nr:probable G-protein coupled receptor B0563.6 [Mercenaria mercenaria]